MKEPVWNQFLTERDKQVFGDAGYGQRAGWGERPVIVVIDVNYNFTGDKPEPILESIKTWPNSCGEEAWESMRHIKRLIEAGRATGTRCRVTQRRSVAPPDRWSGRHWPYSGSWSKRRGVVCRTEC